MQANSCYSEKKITELSICPTCLCGQNTKYYEGPNFQIITEYQKSYLKYL